MRIYDLRIRAVSRYYILGPPTGQVVYDSTPGGLPYCTCVPAWCQQPNRDLSGVILAAHSRINIPYICHTLILFKTYGGLG